jgi:hypothetical protein
MGCDRKFYEIKPLKPRRNSSNIVLGRDVGLK